MAKTKEEKAEYNKQWRIANPSYGKEWAASNRGKMRNKQLKSRYGIDSEQFQAMFLRQAGNCAICKRHQSEFKRTLSVDHNHKNGQVRELLCDLCNRAIGYLQDCSDLVKAAAAYLEKHNGNH